MSFLYLSTHDKRNNIKNNISRKEQDSLLTHHFFHIFHKYQKTERASAFTSKGSITLEAAVVVPIFFFAMLCFAYVLEMMSTQTLVRNALYSVGKEFGQQAYVSTFISSHSLERRIIKNVGTKQIENSLIEGGALGIDCSRSYVDQDTAVLDLSVKYKMKVPILMFKLPVISCEETLRIKGWTGLATSKENEDGQTVVYVTEQGTVYHKDMFCTYLVMSVRTVSSDELATLRNQSGGKYYACEYCADNADNTGRLYVTDYGNRYHVSIGCSTLKRTVYAVPYSEVSERGGCSKCVK